MRLYIFYFLMIFLEYSKVLCKKYPVLIWIILPFLFPALKKKRKTRNRQLIHKNYGEETELTETLLHLDMNMPKCPAYTSNECLKQTQII